MNFRALVVVILAGCATTQGRRLENIAAAELLLSKIGDDDRYSSEFHFHLATLQVEEAESLEKANPEKATDYRLKAMDHYERSAKDAGYERRDEVLFWRADNLYRLRRWTEAVLAWRQVPTPKAEESRLHAQLRLSQSLRRTHQCEESVVLLDGATHPALVEERCRCLEVLDRACPAEEKK